MKSIITGGGGFIGSHLAEKLVKLKHKVIVIDNFSVGNIKNLEKIKNKIKIIKADITNEKKISKLFRNADNVFHLAAMADIVPSIENPKLYFDVNVKGTLNTLNLSIKHFIKRYIYIASSSCYGLPKIFPTPENSDIDPKYPLRSIESFASLSNIKAPKLSLSKSRTSRVLISLTFPTFL